MNINLTLIGHAIWFGIFVWFCMRYVWPPITAALAEREGKIAEGLAAAEKGHHDLKLAERRAADLLRDGKVKAQEYIEHAQKRADEMVEEAKAAARAEGDRLLAAARVQIDQERNQARETLRQEVATLAVIGAERILLREVNEQAHRDILDELRTRI
ncbi:MAG: F0F1 ATP synthase subunit B [Gammaproteobacteria bacterium]|nr:F0F1 ATP synthase subunit B [Gammaproteobacteria bacterium]